MPIIHLAYENIDARLELVATHRPLKRFHITPEGEPATYQRFIKFDSELSNETIVAGFQCNEITDVTIVKSGHKLTDKIL